MKLTGLVLLAGSLVLLGCDKMVGPDLTPPRPPTGISTQTGDGFIEVFWNDNPEGDVAGYNVFQSQSYNGPYQFIGSTHTPYFMHAGLVNGWTYYYAVTAYDFDGNESDLSKDVVYDIPRPEGYNVVLGNFRASPGNSGYDFSDYRVLAYNELYADMYFEYNNGEYYMNVRTDTDIQDMGPTNSLLDIRQAPVSGWSTTHDAVLRVGHTYVVWTWDDHYAKFRVTGLSSGRVVFDWAYQVAVSNPLLRPLVRGGGGRNMTQSGAVR